MELNSSSTSSAAASLKNYVSDKLISILGYSHPTLVSYIIASAEEAATPDDIFNKLLHLGMSISSSDEISDFAHELFDKLSNRTPALNLCDKKEKELVRNAKQPRNYRVIEVDDCDDHVSEKQKVDDCDVNDLRKKSRQDYLKKRAKKKLEEVKDDLDDEVGLFDGVRLSNKEDKRFLHKKEVYDIVKKGSFLDDGAGCENEYRMPEVYDDQRGYSDQKKRFSAALMRERDGFEKQESWEEYQTRKGIVSFGSKDRKQECDDYQLLFDQIYTLEDQLPGQEVDHMEIDDAEMAVDSSKGFDETRKALPIFQLKDELMKFIREHQILVIVGETGSGKTTQIPQYLHEAGYTMNGRIACTQPRRVAAMSVASRVANEMGVKLGHEVGFSIRFEDRTSEKTVLKYMTDGMLLREFMVDPRLQSYSVIMIDEAHERTVSTDILFGLVKDLARDRSDLKLLITSATLEAKKFSDFFDDAPIIDIPGRLHPVDILYKQPVKSYLEEAIAATLHLHVTQPPGDILVFLTGQEDIENAQETLKQQIKHYGSKISELIIYPIFSNLPTELQAKIFIPTPEGARKVVLATNIAETSLTIDGIRYVIDSGFCKMDFYKPGTDMESLQITKVSKASATQRAGRAGRTGPGKCVRLYTSDQYKQLNDNAVPEVQRSNLANLVLTLKVLGIKDVAGFDFMDPPSNQSLIKALELLFALGALNSEGEHTRIGRLIAEFPLDPKLSKALITSEKYGCSEEILTIAAMLSVGNAIFYRPKDQQVLADNAKKIFEVGDAGDHIALLRVYHSWKETNFSTQWCYEHFIQVKSMNRARDIREQLEELMNRTGIELKSNPNDLKAIKKSIISGFFPHIATFQASGSYKTLKSQQTVDVHPSSGLARAIPKPKWVVYHELVFTGKAYMRQVTEAKPEWLLEIAPHYYERSEVEDSVMKKQRSRSSK